MKKILFILLALSTLGSSCKKQVEKQSLLGLTDEVAITNEATAREAVIGMYNALQLQGNYGIYQVSTPGLYADELKSRSALLDVNQIDNNAITPVNFYLGELWNAPYRAVYSANQILQRVPAIASIPDASKKAIIAEAKFIRALSIFNVFKYFGGAPLITSINLAEIEASRRSTADETYQFILNDLMAAEIDLPDTHVSNGSYTSDQVSRTRATKATAKALLARVYLYRAKDNTDLQNAITKATEVIGNISYSLEATYSNAFKLFSKEAIFQIFFESFDGGRLVLEMSPGTQWNYAATNKLVNGFENGDNRKGFLLVPSNGDFYSRKYEAQNSPANVLRLADIYLIRAEARARLSAPDLTGAKADLNMVRTRAGLPNNTAVDIPQFLLDIEQERFIELAYEGHRFFDLVRTNRANTVLGTGNTNWQTTDILFPLPFLEVSKGLTQNQGYN